MLGKKSSRQQQRHLSWLYASTEHPDTNLWLWRQGISQILSNTDGMTNFPPWKKKKKIKLLKKTSLNILVISGKEEKNLAEMTLNIVQMTLKLSGAATVKITATGAGPSREAVRIG